MPRGENLSRDRRPGPGRPKGMQNKVTVSFKEAIEEAFDRLGGVNWLVKIARKEPAVFCQLIGKVLPRKHELSGDLAINFRERLEAARRRLTLRDTLEKGASSERVC